MVVVVVVVVLTHLKNPLLPSVVVVFVNTEVVLRRFRFLKQPQKEKCQTRIPVGKVPS